MPSAFMCSRRDLLLRLAELLTFIHPIRPSFGLEELGC
jgi:hypothetical protein